MSCAFILARFRLTVDAEETSGTNVVVDVEQGPFDVLWLDLIVRTRVLDPQPFASDIFLAFCKNP